MPALQGNSLKVKTLQKQRRDLIVNRYREGVNQKEIAKEIGVTQGRVSQILEQCRQEWAAREALVIGEKIAMEIGELYKVRDAAWEAYVKSQQDAVTVVTKKAPPRKSDDEDDEEPVDLRRRVKKANDQLRVILQEEKRVGQCGDPAYLMIVKDCTLQVLKLLGAFPKEDKTEVNNIVQVNWAEFSSPIECSEPLTITPADEVEARIAAESQPSTNDFNGNVHV